jgi:aminoglycoside phosphotransferase (APT) family kinase protein
MSGEIVAPETRDLDVLRAQLAEWLAGRLEGPLEGENEVRVSNLDYPRGAGQSHETILFDASWLAGGVRHAQGFVVRIKPVRHLVYLDDLFSEQYRLMRLLHEDGRVRVAKTFWFEDSPALLGAPFFIMEKKIGRVPVSIPPYRESGWVAQATPAQRRTMWENGVRQLAMIQSIPLTSVQFLSGPANARDGLAQEWDRYSRFIGWMGGEVFTPVLRAAMARLEKLWPANQPPGLVWGDARLGNMMFDENFDVVAVMDWEQPSLGGALHDLAWWLVLSEVHHAAGPNRPFFEGMGTRGETIALWQELTGISADGVEWYEDFTHLKMSCLSLTTSKMGRHPVPDPAAMARRLKLAS